MKVVIGGDGGDELFGGYDRYYGYQYAEPYAQLPAARAPSVSVRCCAWCRPAAGTRAADISCAGCSDVVQSGGERYAGSLSYFYFDARGAQHAVLPTHASALSGFDAEACIREPFDACRPSLWTACYTPMRRCGCADHPVMITDRMTMAHGLEARSPFMDHMLAEFAARLPCDMKVRGNSLRYMQRRLASRYLPQSLLQRPKQGFCGGNAVFAAAGIPPSVRGDAAQIHSWCRTGSCARRR